MSDRGRGGRGRGESREGRGGFQGPPGGRGGSQGPFRGRGGYPGGGGSRASGEDDGVFRDGLVSTPINPRVQKLENEFIANSHKSGKGIPELGNLTLGNTFPVRPGHGVVGKPITVFANFFEITPTRDVAYFRYNVTVVAHNKAPAVSKKTLSKKKTRRMFQLLLQDPRFDGAITDFSSFLITVAPLVFIGDGQSITIAYMQDGEDEARENPAMYDFTIKAAANILVSDYCDYLMNSVASTPPFPMRDEALQAMNVVIGQSSASNSSVVKIGQNKIFPVNGNPAQSFDLGGAVQAIRGLFKSVRPATGRLLLNVNLSHSACYKPGPLENVMGEFLQSSRLRDLGPFLKFAQIERRHLPIRKNKAGRKIPGLKSIWDLAHPQDGYQLQHPPKVQSYGSGPKQVEFWLDDSPQGSSASPNIGRKGKKATPAASTGGKYITVWDYFQQNYPHVRMEGKFPVVNVGNRLNPMYLPAEAGLVPPGQPIRGKLSPACTASMITFACRRPKFSANFISSDARGLLGLDSPDNSMMTKFGVAVGQNLITVPARVLYPPAIIYGTKQQKPKFGSWNLEGLKFSKGSSIDRWGWVVLRDPGRRSVFPNYEAVEAVMQRFISLMRATGISFVGANAVPKANSVIRVHINPEADAEAIEAWMNQAAAKKLQFLFVVLPYSDAALYRQIKTVGDTKLGISTVCMIESKFAKEQRQEQYFANVAMKVNLKAGGINSTLEPAKLGIIAQGKTIVIGIDVTHPQPGALRNAPSVAGVVASTDKTLGQWPADLRVQMGRKEMVTDLRGMIMSRLVLWQKKNGAYPENILVYRDGVSEGQYNTVLDEEVPHIRAAARALYPADMTKIDLPRVSIIVVGKRHHTRFYPTSKADCDRSFNCSPGTVVDRGVVEVRNWDFFLQAHACLQGTARPAHYYVILDEIFKKSHSVKPADPKFKSAADALEDLTHNMCHLFGRATKAVSICPPAYYADLLCERARAYLGGIYDPSTTSEAPEGSVTGSEFSEDVVIHPNLRDTMFYI